MLFGVGMNQMQSVSYRLHCGLWSGQKCAYETDLLPQSRSSGRGAVHNYAHLLHEVGMHFKMAACLKVEWNTPCVSASAYVVHALLCNA